MIIHNTLTNKKELLEETDVKMFVCGPTVYDYGHIGHARSAIAFDMIAKFLRFLGIKVNYIMNITDIDDKIIKRAKERGESWEDLARTFEKYYLEDIGVLGVDAPDKFPRATEYMDQIKDQVDRMLKKGIAYVIEGDGIYFDISQFEEYGKLSKQDLSELKAGARVAVAKGKRNEGDFVVWKFAKDGEPHWGASFGEGRPGWHIEDTAITEKEFGPSYTLHGGGLDLIFPHHECEIAQMESISGQVPLAKYWMHNGYVMINNEKMSKSLNNFWTIRDVLKKFSPRAARYYCLSVHYRAPINYSEEALQHAENAVKRLDDFVTRLKSADGGEFEIEGVLKVAEQKFLESMENDFETSAALAAIFDLVREVNALIDANELSKSHASEVLDFLEKINQVLGIFDLSELEIPSEVQSLIDAREEARKNNDFKESDHLREQIKEKGFLVEDSKDGVRIKKI